MNCPECNTKLRKFKEGVICNRNHKFLEGTQIYDKFYNKNTYVDPKLLCPKCGEKGIFQGSHCFCGDCDGINCINGHIWHV